MDVRILLEKAFALLKGAYQFRWMGLLASLILAVAGWVFVYFLPDYYRANSRIYIDTQSLLQPLMKDISVSLDPDVRIQKMTKLLLSLPNLERIARMSDLDLEYTTPSEKEAFLKKLERNIKFNRQGRSNLFSLSYEHEDPAVAKLVVQSVLNLFMELTLSDTRTDTIVAQRFLEGQIGQVEDRLIKAEQGLAAFKRHNMSHLPRQDLSYYESLQTLQIDRESTKLDIAIVESKQESLEKQLRGEEPVLGLSTSGDLRLLHPLIRSLHELEDQHKQLSQFYTTKHPDVQRLAAQMKALREQIDSERNDTRWSLTADELNKNPVYQQIKIQLSEATSELAALKAKEREIDKQINLMENKVDNMIETEARFSSLNRDYQSNQQQYQSLLVKKEAARFAEDIDDTAENFKFNIVDPPYVTAEPVWPKRGLFNLAVLLASFIGGIVTSLGLSQLKPTFYDKFSIEQTLGLPVLATLSFDKTPSFVIQTRREHIMYATGVMALIASFLVVYLLTGAGVI